MVESLSSLVKSGKIHHADVLEYKNVIQIGVHGDDREFMSEWCRKSLPLYIKPVIHMSFAERGSFKVRILQGDEL